MLNSYTYVVSRILGVLRDVRPAVVFAESATSKRVTVEKYVVATVHVICGFHPVLSPHNSPKPKPPPPSLKVSISAALRTPISMRKRYDELVCVVSEKKYTRLTDGLVSTIWMAPLTDHSSDPQTTKWVSNTTTVRNACTPKSKHTMLMPMISSSCKPLPKRLATPGPHLVRSARLQSSQKTSSQGQGCNARCSSSDPTATCSSRPDSPL